MKNKSFKLGLSYFFSKDASNHLPELVIPESEWKGTESVSSDILRWADDGGKMLDLDRQVKPGYSPGTGKRVMNVRGKGS